MQAEAQAQALWEAIEGTVATKQDLQLVRQEIRELEARIDGRFKEVDGRFRLLYWMVGFNLAILIKLLMA